MTQPRAIRVNDQLERRIRKPADALLTFIRTRMPPTAAGSLTPQATAGVVAYLLQVNGAKAGDAEISRHVVACKSEVEKIREQVQNLE